MPQLGQYAAEVLWAYSASGAVLAVLIWTTWARSRAVRQALEAAEAAKDNG